MKEEAAKCSFEKPGSPFISPSPRLRGEPHTRRCGGLMMWLSGCCSVRSVARHRRLNSRSEAAGSDSSPQPRSGRRQQAAQVRLWPERTAPPQCTTMCL